MLGTSINEGTVISYSTSWECWPSLFMFGLLSVLACRRWIWVRILFSGWLFVRIIEWFPPYGRDWGTFMSSQFRGSLALFRSWLRQFIFSFFCLSFQYLSSFVENSIWVMAKSSAESELSQKWCWIMMWYYCSAKSRRIRVITSVRCQSEMHLAVSDFDREYPRIILENGGKGFRYLTHNSWDKG